MSLAVAAPRPRPAARTRAVAVALALGALGCGARPVPPPPSAPALREPMDAVPPDLDVVVRIDVKRLATALGPGWSAARASLGTAPGWTLTRTERLVLAFRPDADFAPTDGVLALAGDFAGFDPRSLDPSWGAPLDEGGDVRSWDRTLPPGPGPRGWPRSEPVRILARGESLVVFVTAGALDAVERRLEGAGAAPLEPPGQGALGIAVRGRAVQDVARGRLGSLPGVGGFLRGVETAEGTLDLDTGGVRASVALRLQTPALAADGRDALILARGVLTATGGTLGGLAAEAEITAVSDTLGLRLALTPEQLARLMACAEGDGEC